MGGEIKDSAVAPLDDLLADWKKQATSYLNFIRQRRIILRQPEILRSPEVLTLQGWSSPLAFALKSAAIVLLISNGLHWIISEVAPSMLATPPEIRLQASVDQVQRQMDEAQIYASIKEKEGDKNEASGAREKLPSLQSSLANLKRQLKVQKAVNGISGAIVSVWAPLTLIATALLVRRSIRKQYKTEKVIFSEDGIYLYIASACGFWVTLVSVVGTQNFLLATLDSDDPSGLTMVPIFIGNCLMFPYYLGLTRRMYTALGLPQPPSLWRKSNRIFSFVFWSSIVAVVGALAVLVALMFLVAYLIAVIVPA